VVDVVGGGVAVEHVVVGPRGRAVAPCASQASTTWYVANGSTDRDAVEVLALFNPFPDDAVADVTFQTNDGIRQPPDVQGLPVPAGRTVYVNVGESASRHALVSSVVVA